MPTQNLLNTWAQIDAAVDIVQASGLGADLTLVGANNPEIKGADADGVLTVTCDATAAAGGNARFFAGGHATQPNDVELRGGASVALHYDDSASLIDLQANALQTTGTAALGATTITGDLNTDDIIVSNGNGLVVGHASMLTVGNATPEVQILGAFDQDSQLVLGRFSANATNAELKFVKSRAAIGAQAIIVTADKLGGLGFYGDDGGDYVTQGAEIRVVTEGTIGVDRIPTKLDLRTGTDAAPTVVTTALSADSAQLITLAAGLTVSSGVVTVPDGAVGAPSIVWSGSLTSGAFQSGADIIDFANAGVLTMELGADNTVGIGVAAGAGTTVKIQGAGTDIVVNATDSAATSFFRTGTADQVMSAAGASATNTAIRANKDGTTSRSINAAGTINASGADYAEYRRLCQRLIDAAIAGADGIAKGALVGFDADGKVTDRYSEAVSFGVKSTDPSYVGGDVWSSEERIGAQPEEPRVIALRYPDIEKPRALYDEPILDAEDEPVDPGSAPEVSPIRLSDETDESYTNRQQSEGASMALWGANKAQYDRDQPRYKKVEERHAAQHGAWEAAKVDYDAALALFDEGRAGYHEALAKSKLEVEEALPGYESDLAVWRDRLERARQEVDRIGYSGEVPCNVTGGAAGDYIIAEVGQNDTIIGKAVAAPTAAQIRNRVGRVTSFLPDGRVELCVIRS